MIMAVKANVLTDILLRWPSDSRDKNSDAADALGYYLHLLIVSYLERMISERDKLLQGNVRYGLCFCSHIHILL